MQNCIFISYVSTESEWLNQLRICLKPYLKNATLTIFDDTEILPGEERAVRIAQALHYASAAVVLVSQDYLACDEILETELRPLLEAGRTQGLPVFWLPIRYSTYRLSPIINATPLHDPERPLGSIQSQALTEHALIQVCERLAAALNLPVERTSPSVLCKLAPTSDADRGSIIIHSGLSRSVRQIVRILRQRQKSHALLLGKPGIGKRTIIRYLADYSRIHRLDFIVYKYIFDPSKMNSLTEEFYSIARQGNVVLWIENLADLCSSFTEIDQELQKLFISEGVHLISSATSNFCSIQGAAAGALVGRFTALTVNEPEVEDTTLVIRQEATTLERHHGLRITDCAIAAAVELALQYQQDEGLPGKAITLLDEASAYARYPSTAARDHVHSSSEIDGAVIRYVVARKLGISSIDLLAK